jgi:hypothetical protein
MFTHETTYAVALIAALVAAVVTTWAVLSGALDAIQIF